MYGETFFIIERQINCIKYITVLLKIKRVIKYYSNSIGLYDIIHKELLFPQFTLNIRQ